jgi:hypothetical protein
MGILYKFAAKATPKAKVSYAHVYVSYARG